MEKKNNIIEERATIFKIKKIIPRMERKIKEELNLFFVYHSFIVADTTKSNFKIEIYLHAPDHNNIRNAIVTIMIEDKA